MLMANVSDCYMLMCCLFIITSNDKLLKYLRKVIFNVYAYNKDMIGLII